MAGDGPDLIVGAARPAKGAALGIQSVACGQKGLLAAVGDDVGRRLSIGTQRGPLIVVQKGPPCLGLNCVVRVFCLA